MKDKLAAPRTTDRNLRRIVTSLPIAFALAAGFLLGRDSFSAGAAVAFFALAINLLCWASISDSLTNGLRDRGEDAAAREIERLRGVIHDHKLERARLLTALRDLNATVVHKVSEALNG